MERLLAILTKQPANTEPRGFRLSENPFYLKFCPRIVFDPDKPDLIRGMYMSIDYWKILKGHPGTVGQRKGRMLTFENAGRYLDNTSFMALVANAWIGTNPNQTDVLSQIVKAILEGHRSIIVAIKFDKSDVGEIVIDLPPKANASNANRKRWS
jgi:hypothetical protein